jgi:alkanesulfonate monooxygenase SsuD/methylene tetrahydromethanopterin reductase-like flavin-dependent oxidoreductase (luciferase family)
VRVPSTQHPIALAEQAALLDQLSGGLFRLGVGRGGPWIDLEAFGTGVDRYQHGFPESLDLHPVGTPEHCLDKLRTTAQRTGIGHIMLMVEGAGDRARTLENITRLGAELLPPSARPDPTPTSAAPRLVN